MTLKNTRAKKQQADESPVEVFQKKQPVQRPKQDFKIMLAGESLYAKSELIIIDENYTVNDEYE